MSEYIRDPVLLAEAVNAAYGALPMLLQFAATCTAYAVERNLASPPAPATRLPDSP